MKGLATILASVLMFAFSANVYGQTYATDRGSFLIGGTAGFSSQGFDGGDRITTVLVNPQFGYFIVPGLAIGAEISVSSISFGGDSVTDLGIGPFLAYFFGDATSTMFPFVGAGMAYTSSDGDLTTLGGEVQAGLVFMVARNVGLTTAAFGRYTSTSVSGFSGSLSGNAFGVRAGVTAFIF
jgi:outer membrane protein W